MAGNGLPAGALVDGQPMQLGDAQHTGDPLAATPHAHSESRFGIPPERATDAMRIGMTLHDRLEQQCILDGSRLIAS